jgi:D-lactate dehydrogenase
MKVAFFSTQSYDKDFFNRYNNSQEIIYFEASLNEQTVNLADGCKVICAFVNDKSVGKTGSNLDSTAMRRI